MNLRWASCGEMLQGALFFCGFLGLAGRKCADFCTPGEMAWWRGLLGIWGRIFWENADGGMRL